MATPKELTIGNLTCSFCGNLGCTLILPASDPHPQCLFCFSKRHPAEIEGITDILLSRLKDYYCSWRLYKCPR